MTNNYITEEQVLNAKPEELTLILYEACEDFIIRGIDFLKQKNYEQVNNFLQRAENIINELRCTLNFKYEISQQLDKLYAYIYDNLVHGNIKNDFNSLNNALYVVTTLKETWIQVINK